MTSFINPGYATEHQGVERLQSFAEAASHMGQQFKGGKGLVAILLAGAISALVVVMDQIVSIWTDGHLFLAWVTLWALVFGAMALFTKATHGWTARILVAVEQWLARSRERAEDARIWATAQSDPRFMADIQAARVRSENEARALNKPLPAWPFSDKLAHTNHARPW